MKSLKLPSKTQLLITALLWFLVSICFQAAQVYRTAHYVNVMDVCISSALLMVAVFFIYILQRYTTNYFNNIFTRIGLLAVLVFKVVFLQKFLLARLVYDEAYAEVFSETIVIRTFAAFLVISFFSIILWLVFHIKKINDEALMKQSAENSLRDAELIKLRQQMQPHFLFNSLNSINALIGSEPALARKMIQTLSDFLRGTLKKDEDKPVSFTEEISLLKLYLDVEKIRFAERLVVNFDMDELVFDKTIPPLLLQPIVENAIKFGLYNVLENVEINISAKTKDGILVITVANPFDESTASTKKGEGFGLSLIARRLQLIYHRADLLKIEKQNNIFKTTILIPQV